MMLPSFADEEVFLASPVEKAIYAAKSPSESG